MRGLNNSHTAVGATAAHHEAHRPSPSCTNSPLPQQPCHWEAAEPESTPEATRIPAAARSHRTFLVAGRLGRVLTHELGSSALRGSFEMDLDLIPINEFWIGGHAQFAGAINPFIAKWNFTGGQTVSPYVAAVGGIVLHSHQLPAPDTSQVNFTSGAELGLQWFHRPKRSWDFAAKVVTLRSIPGTPQPRHQRRGAVHGRLHLALGSRFLPVEAADFSPVNLALAISWALAPASHRLPHSTFFCLSWLAANFRYASKQP